MLLVGAALLAPLLTLVAAQQTITSRGAFGSNTAGVTYQCPTRQTIETAFFGYCAASNSNNVGLTGITSYIPYSRAPTYETVADEYELFCGYPTGSSDPVCAFQAGGGNPLTLNPSRTNEDCSAPSAGVPQPSGGGNYRRSGDIERRATLGTSPTFVCPFTSTDPAVFLTETQIDAGSFAADTVTAQGLSGVDTSTDLVFTCTLGTGDQTNPSVSCFYVQNAAGTAVFLNSAPASEANACPTTLCTAILDGSGNQMRKRAFLEGRALRIHERQADPRRIRDKNARKRRLADALKAEPSW